jgi:hypothetical protein
LVIDPITWPPVLSQATSIIVSGSVSYEPINETIRVVLVVDDSPFETTTVARGLHGSTTFTEQVNLSGLNFTGWSCFQFFAVTELGAVSEPVQLDSPFPSPSPVPSRSPMGHLPVNYGFDCRDFQLYSTDEGQTIPSQHCYFTLLLIDGT